MLKFFFLFLLSSNIAFDISSWFIIIITEPEQNKQQERVQEGKLLWCAAA
jgi:hypothetical protein